MFDVQARHTVVKSNARMFPDSKDPRIGVNKISIRRDSVGSISNRRRFEGLCYLGSSELRLFLLVSSWWNKMLQNQVN